MLRLLLHSLRDIPIKIVNAMSGLEKAPAFASTRGFDYASDSSSDTSITAEVSFSQLY